MTTKLLVISLMLWCYAMGVISGHLTDTRGAGKCNMEIEQ